MTAVERLAALADDVRVGDLPEEVVAACSQRLLDALGCMLGGVRGDTVRATYDAVGAGGDGCTLVGDHRRAAPPLATLANTAAMRYLDFMDGHPGPYSCHPGLAVPAVLAVAERQRSSGAAVLRAIALAYEIDIRLQLGSGDPDISSHGWSGSTNLGIAVPVAVAGLLGLDRVRAAHAIGMSTVHAPTLDASAHGQMSDSKTLVDAMVASSAVTASLLAGQGVSGPLSAYDGEQGFVGSVAHEFREDVLLAPVERFRILDSYTKYFNSVKCGQTAAAAALELRPQLGDLAGIDRILVRIPERDRRNQLKSEDERRRPRTRDTANHSAVYCVAAALVDGDLQAAQFAPERLSDPRIHGLIDRTSLDSDPELTAMWPRSNPARVEVTMRDGRVLTSTVLYSPGHPQNPLTDAQVEAKFRGLADGVIAPDAIDAVVDTVGRLEEIDDISSLMTLLVKERDR